MLWKKTCRYLYDVLLMSIHNMFLLINEEHYQIFISKYPSLTPVLLNSDIP